ncbi:MAG: adenosylcobalamin-dependent ribonucleoside-diphosphate reductase [Candidatus Atribacteria bacterium]|nr:adenosylcobalamin-dependent ribonucleoside-diphosphate reductase [Candidatus Atribacteria bacterium]
MVEDFFSQVKKRDGSLEPFTIKKITQAIEQALHATGFYQPGKAEEFAHEVVKNLKVNCTRPTPLVEEIQDEVERVLMNHSLLPVAKAYILYREKRREIREAKWKLFGVHDDLKLSFNAIQVLKERYLLKNEEGEIQETPKAMMKRVAKAVAEADGFYGQDVNESYEKFYQLLTSLEFLPNSPTLMNAGTSLGQLSACFVLPVEDSIEGIFNTLRDMAIIHKSGGGTGFNFSQLRPKGDRVSSTGGRASGPVSFMRIFDTATDVVKQGGRRRGANMGILRFNHPDIREFIKAKNQAGFLENFNLSVAITDEEMERVHRGEKINLIDPHLRKAVSMVNARELFDLIVESAWKSGEPGLVFIDEINRNNPTPSLGLLEATNPCGEVPLLPYESCNLGSINLSKMSINGKIDYQKLQRVVFDAVHFLDNIIDVNRYPLPMVQKIVKANRKIGLGVMGFTDLLCKLGISYYSNQALQIAEHLITFIAAEAKIASKKLAERRGVFPNYSKSIYAAKNLPLRNATLISIAPTGTISLIAGCSSGIEPYFALIYRRFVLEKTELIEINPLLEEQLKALKVEEKIRKQIWERGSLKDIDGVPESLHSLFLTALEIPSTFQVQIQAVFQKQVDNAVSKTINLPTEATPEEVSQAYFLAHQLHCKGITIYRYQSRESQVFYLGTGEKECENC